MTFAIAGEPVAFRPMRPGDESYVLATWLRSFRDLVPRKLVPDSRFFAWVRPLAEASVRNGQVVVACAEKMDSTLYGWACMVNGAPVYVYVMAGLRGHGLGKKLVEALR